MEDNKIWFYIIAAIIYFLTRRKKKKQQQSQPQPTEANRPQQHKKPVSFEDLLKEITEKRVEEVPAPAVEQEDEPVYKASAEEGEEKIRHFADEESKRVYEKSIALAKSNKSGDDRKFEPNKNYTSKKMFKGEVVDEGAAFAEEIRADLQTTHSARKAIIYSEILNRKY